MDRYGDGDVDADDGSLPCVAMPRKPLFECGAAPLLGESTRAHADPRAPAECNACGHVRTVEEARLNNEAIREAAVRHFKEVGTRTCVEAEGWLKLVLGERDVVWCAQCKCFSGECCSLPLARLSTNRTVRALVVDGATYLGTRYDGSIVVIPEHLADFYQALLKGDLVMHVRCACDSKRATCDAHYRACCHAACAAHGNTRQTIPQLCDCRIETHTGPASVHALLDSRERASMTTFALSVVDSHIARKSAPPPPPPPQPTVSESARLLLHAVRASFRRSSIVSGAGAAALVPNKS